MSRTFTTDEEFIFRAKFFKGCAHCVLAAIVLLIVLLVSSAAAAATAMFPAITSEMSLTEQLVWSALGVAAVCIGVYYWKGRYLSFDMDPNTGTLDSDKKPGVRSSLPKPSRPAPSMPSIPEPRAVRATDMPRETPIIAHIPNVALLSNQDNMGVFFFSEAMRQELHRSRVSEERNGWWQEDLVTLDQLAVDLRVAMRTGNLVNIATLCMMLHQRGVTSLAK